MLVIITLSGQLGGCERPKVAERRKKSSGETLHLTLASRSPQAANELSRELLTRGRMIIGPDRCADPAQPDRPTDCCTLSEAGACGIDPSGCHMSSGSGLALHWPMQWARLAGTMARARDQSSEVGGPAGELGAG